MKPLSQADLRHLLTTLRELYTNLDLETFPASILSILSHLIPTEVSGYNEVNPRHVRIAAVIEPNVGDAQAFITHMHEHPLIRHYQQTNDGRVLKISDFLTQRQFHRLALYNEFFRPQGIEHQIALTLPAPPPLVIGIALNRSRPDFSERERQLLELIRPHLIQAYHNAEAVSRLKQQHIQLGRQVVEEWERGVIVLNREGQVRLWTEQARRWVTKYFGKIRSARFLPPPLQRWVTQQLSLRVQHTNVPPPRLPLIVEQEDTQLIVRLVAAPEGDQQMLLLEEQRTTLSITSLAPLGLTQRETDVLFWVMQGKTNQEIASILTLSPLTVRTHLEHIYRKLEVETRTAATRQALETLGLFRR
jgi:DNA-binding CsgD family transcriptional regulator